MKITSLFKKVLPVFLAGFLWSCDEDFNSVESGIIGDENTNINSIYFDNAIAYSRETGVVQSGNLPINSLGVINNPVFGKTIASYVTQLYFSGGINPAAGIENATVTRVELTIPYFNTLKETDSDGNRTFELDSLYGETGKFKLNVYESGYYLRDYDPSTNFEEYQKYFSDMYDEINNAKVGSRLNDSFDQAQNEMFYFSDEEYIIYDEIDETVVKERIVPQMRLVWIKNFFSKRYLMPLQDKWIITILLPITSKGCFFRLKI